MPEVKPMPYHEAKSYAKKYNLVMRCIDYPELFFQIDNNFIYFFIKTEKGEINPLAEEMRDYYPDYAECFYKPSSKKK